MINKHTHVETKYVHVFHPKVAPPAPVPTIVHHHHPALHHSHHSSLHHRYDPYPLETLKDSFETFRHSPRYKSRYNDFSSYNKKKYYPKKYPRHSSSQSFEDFFNEEASVNHYDYYDMADSFPLDRQADAYQNPMVDKIYITTPGPLQSHKSKIRPQFAKQQNAGLHTQVSPQQQVGPQQFAPQQFQQQPNSAAESVLQEIHFTTAAPNIHRPTSMQKQAQQNTLTLRKVKPTPPHAKLQTGSTLLNIRFVTPKPRFPKFSSYTTPFPMKRPSRQKFKQSETMKMIQIPMNTNAENDLSIMLKPKKQSTKDGEKAEATQEMEHTIKAKTSPNNILNILNKKAALSEAVLKPFLIKA